MTIQFTPGRNLSVADALIERRAYLPQLPEDELNLESQVHMVLSNLLISDTMLNTFQTETDKGQVLQKLQDVLSDGWPHSESHLPKELTPYFAFRHEISEANGILMKGERVIVPSTMRKDMKQRIHEGHLGIEKCKLTEIIQKCSACQEQRKYRQKEPLMLHTPPIKSWEKMATDLFKLQKNDYVVVVDYYSDYPEIAKLESTTSQQVIQKIKSILSRHGTPNKVMSDKGPH